MRLRQIFENTVSEVAIIFGRFNPPHKGHRAAWELASKSPVWYVGTNETTVGPKDPLPYDVKVEAMKTVWPEVESHIVAETGWLTLASKVYQQYPDATLLCLTDEDWVTKTIQQYNGKEGQHGFYNFKNIKQTPTPRLSSATALRDAVTKGDKDAFTQAAGVSADTPVAGKPFFDLVAEYLLPYANAPKKIVKKKKVDEPVEDVSEDVEEEPNIHRVRVTVTDPNADATFRNKEVQKIVRVTADDGPEAIKKAKDYYTKKGFKVHNHHYIGPLGTNEDSLNEIGEPTTNYYTLGNGKLVQVTYRPNINQSPIPMTAVKVSYVDPALKPQGPSFDSTGQAERWDSAPDGVKQAIEKFVRQPQLQQGVAEGKDDKIAQLKKDHETAVYWSKNDTNPHKREAARQKAEKIKRHLETQYKQGVAEGSLEEYGDTAKGQKMLTKVQKRAVDRVVSKKADTDPKYAKKNSDTANRAWDRMDTSESMSERIRDPEDWDEGNTEPGNNFAVYINGKKWKVLPGPAGAYADSPEEKREFQRLKDMAARKSAATGKKWEVYITGEPATK